MAGELLRFPLGKHELFSREINCEVLRSSEVNRVLYAAIRALPHVQNSRLREELKSAICDLPGSAERRRMSRPEPGCMIERSTG